MKSRFWFLAILLCADAAFGDWFEELKEGDDQTLYRVLYYMPKGGDLHNHLSGSNYSEWWYDLAVAQEDRGYTYYTKVRIENCAPYGGDRFGPQAYLLLFRNIAEAEYNDLDACEKREFKRLQDLTEVEKTAWLESIRLDKPYEGREEFFQTHWQRLGAMVLNPYLQAETLYRNMHAFGEEGLSYLETQVYTHGAVRADGSIMPPEETAGILMRRTQEADALETGVTVRFQIALLRFTPNAESTLREIYSFVYDNSDMFAAVNMVGREDNDKGYPLRFLETLRELRRDVGDVRLSIHAGEVDEPNDHVRDTLLLGAERIGHGLNLITDDDTMLLMRHGRYLVEINLVSNYLLQYVNDYAQHPFPEYLRTGIPVALSTDDRGMWDSTMTDEFFVAVREFDLTWNEIKLLSQNSLQYAFVEPETKARLLQDYRRRIEDFERNLERFGTTDVGPMPVTRQFICRQYGICGQALSDQQ